MALQSFGGFVPWPQTGTDIGTTPNYTTTQYTIDAAGEKAAAIFRVPKTGTISAVTFRTATVTTGDTVDVRLETVDLSTGFPSGSLFGTNTNASQVIGSGDDNTMFTTTLTAGASVTVGDLIACVIVNGGGGGSMQIVGFTANSAIDFPFGALYTGSWAGVIATPIMAGMQYNDSSYSYIPNIPVAETITQTAYSSSTNPNHRALQFQVTVPCRVSGFWAAFDCDNDTDVLLVDDNWDGTNGDALARTSIDKDVRRSTVIGSHIMPFPNTVTLTANTIYRLVLKPTTTSNIIMGAFTVASAAQLDQAGANQNCYLSTANNPNDSTDWTPTTTTRPLMGILIDQFDDGTSVGGTGVYNLAMQ